MAERLRGALREPSRRTWVVALALTLLVGVLPALPTFGDPGPEMDEGLLLVEPEQLLDGRLPNRDFESFYGPANTQVLAAVYGLAGPPSVKKERAVGLGYRLALIAALFLLASAGGLTAAVLSGLGCAALMCTQGLPAYAYFGGLALAVLGVVLLGWAVGRSGRDLESGEEPAAGPGAVQRHATAFAAAGGVALGLSMSYRPQFGTAIVLAALVLCVKRPAVPWRALLAGTAVGLLPLLVHLVLAGPAPVWDNLVVDALFKSAPQSTLPFPPPSDDDKLLTVLILISMAALLAAAVVAWRRAPGAMEWRWLGAGLALGVGLAPQAIGRVDGTHLIEVGAVTVPLLPFALIVLARGRLKGAWAVAASAVVSVALVVGLGWAFVQPMWPGLQRAFGKDEAFEVPQLFRGERAWPAYYYTQITDGLATIEAVDSVTEPGDRLLVGPSDLRMTDYTDTYLYHLFPDLTPGTYYLSMTPGTANGEEGSRLPDDLRQADVVVLGTRPENTGATPEAELGPEEPVEILAEDFCLVAQNAIHRVYERCS